MTSKPQTQHCIACRFPNRIKHCQGSHPAIRFRCTISQHGIFIFRPLLEVMHYFISICISIWPQGLYIHLVLTVLRFFPNTILPEDGETKDVLHFEQPHASALGQNSERSILHPTLFHFPCQDCFTNSSKCHHPSYHRWGEPEEEAQLQAQGYSSSQEWATRNFWLIHVRRSQTFHVT